MSERIGMGAVNLVIAIVAFEVFYQTGSVMAVLGSALCAGAATAIFYNVLRDIL
jgi:hypothetical protein